jgi:hypothetical protein
MGQKRTLKSWVAFIPSHKGKGLSAPNPVNHRFPYVLRIGRDKAMPPLNEYFPIGSSCRIRLEGLQAKCKKFVNDAEVYGLLQTVGGVNLTGSIITFTYERDSLGVYGAVVDIPSDLIDSENYQLMLSVYAGERKDGKSSLMLKIRRPAKHPVN